MRIPVPDLSWTQPIIEGYEEDGVHGTAEYDPETGQWYVNLNDNEYKQYMENLRKRHDEACEIVRKQQLKGVNTQFTVLAPPGSNQTRLTMYLAHPECGTVKAFKITGTIQGLLERKYALIGCSSRCNFCNKQEMVLMIWEDVKPEGGKED